MPEFIPEREHIYRLRIPFFSVYTSVFLVALEDGYILMDCATTREDVEEYILPALQKKGISPDEVRYLVVSHRHEDHAGGLAGLQEYCRNAETVTAVRPLAEGVETYPMAGHTPDSIGLLDLRSGTLISADGIQGHGVGIYRCSTHGEGAYLDTLARVGGDGRILSILFSHAYEPWCRDHAFGKEAIEACLRDSLDYIIKRRMKNESDRDQ